MGAFHYCKVVAVGTEEEMETMLRSMIINYNESFGAQETPAEGCEGLHQQILALAREKNENWGFLMNMIRPHPDGGLASKPAPFTLHVTRNGLYAAVFEYLDYWEFYLDDFLALHNQAEGIYLCAIHAEDEPGQDSGFVEFMAGRARRRPGGRGPIVYQLLCRKNPKLTRYWAGELIEEGRRHRRKPYKNAEEFFEEGLLFPLGEDVEDVEMMDKDPHGLSTVDSYQCRAAWGKHFLFDLFDREGYNRGVLQAVDACFLEL